MTLDNWNAPTRLLPKANSSGLGGWGNKLDGDGGDFDLDKTLQYALLVSHLSTLDGSIELGDLTCQMSTLCSGLNSSTTESHLSTSWMVDTVDKGRQRVFSVPWARLCRGVIDLVAG